MPGPFGPLRVEHLDGRIELVDHTWLAGAAEITDRGFGLVDALSEQVMAALVAPGPNPLLSSSLTIHV